MHARKTIITCAVTGNIVTPEQYPNLPITPEQIANAALEAPKPAPLPRTSTFATPRRAARRCRSTTTPTSSTASASAIAR